MSSTDCKDDEWVSHVYVRLIAFVWPLIDRVPAALALVPHRRLNYCLAYF